jgi:cytochrome c5
VRNYDLEFLKHFSMVIGFLALVTLGLIAAAFHLHGLIPPEVSPTAASRTAARIHPAGSVYAGDTGAAAQAAAAAAAVAKAASQVAYGGTTDGKTIFDHLCTTCHATGATGAPKITDKAAWAPRIKEGVDTLVKHAIDGYTGPDGNHMPAKGGNPALTDEQVEATVKWMVSQVQ